MLYKNGEKSSIADILGLNAAQLKEEMALCNISKIFTVLEKDLSVYNIEDGRGMDRVIPATPTSVHIPCVYNFVHKGQYMEIRYVEQARAIRGTQGEKDFLPTHIEIGKTGVLMTAKKDFEKNWFLMNHPSNATNAAYETAGKTYDVELSFQEFHPIVRAQKMLAKIDGFKIVEAKIRGENAISEDLLRATASRCIDLGMETSFYDYKNQPLIEIQVELLRLADLDVERMNVLLCAWDNDIEAVVNEAVTAGHVFFDQVTANWMLKGIAKNERICNVEAGKDPKRFLIDWLSSKDTKNFYPRIAKAIGLQVEALR